MHIVEIVGLRRTKELLLLDIPQVGDIRTVAIADKARMTTIQLIEE